MSGYKICYTLRGGNIKDIRAIACIDIDLFHMSNANAVFEKSCLSIWPNIYGFPTCSML